jgi:hypothetical protein
MDGNMGAPMASSDDSPRGARSRRAPTGVERDLIAENLRSVFGAVEAEAMPDRFKLLLAKLAEQEKAAEEGES